MQDLKDLIPGAVTVTHTGDVTGTTALLLSKTALSGRDTETAVSTDYVLIGDTSDSDNLKRALISDFAPTGFADPMISRGDIIIRNPSNVTARLTKGAADQVLTSDGTDVGWAAPVAGFSDPMTSTGDIIVRDSSNVTAKLSRGAADQVLTSDGTNLSWETPSSGFSDPMSASGDIIIRNSSNVTTNLAHGTADQVLTSDGTNLSWETPTSSGGVSSVNTKVGAVVLDQDDIGNGTTYVRTTNDYTDAAVSAVSTIPSKASIASPTLTGLPLAPTAATGTNTTQLATTAFVQAAASETTGTVLNVKDYGTNVGTGNATTDTNAIKAAVAAASDGDVIYFPQATSYKISSQVTVPDRVIIEGNNNAFILSNGITAFDLTGPDTIIQNMVITGDRTTGQVAIKLYADNITVRNIRLYLLDTGIWVAGGVWHHIIKIRSQDIKTTVLNIGNIVGTRVIDFNYNTNTGSYSQPTRGILLQGEGCILSHMDFIHAGRCVEILASSVHNPTWNIFSSCTFDTSVNGLYISQTSSSYFVRGQIFNNCWFGSHSGAGVYLAASQLLDGLIFNGCHFINNAHQAIYMSGSIDNVDINGCVFGTNSAGTTTYATIDTNATGVKLIRNCFFSEWGFSTFPTGVLCDIKRGSTDGECVVSNCVSSGGYTNQGVVTTAAGADAIDLGFNFGGLPTHS